MVKNILNTITLPTIGQRCFFYIKPGIGCFGTVIGIDTITNRARISLDNCLTTYSAQFKDIMFLNTSKQTVNNHGTI